MDVTEAAPESVKTFKDFAQILADEKVDVWNSHRPAKSGATGAMLDEIIEQAAKLRIAGESKPRRNNTRRRRVAR